MCNNQDPPIFHKIEIDESTKEPSIVEIDAETIEKQEIDSAKQQLKKKKKGDTMLHGLLSFGDQVS